MMMRLSCLLAAVWLAAVVPPVAAEAAAPWVISGATGRTGALTYKLMKSRGVPVRALIRSAAKAKEVIGCDKCDESEGIFIGDITKPASMDAVMQGAGGLIIATSAVPQCNPFPKCSYPEGAYPVDIDFNGGKHQVEAFVKGAGGLKPVFLISSMGTTEPDSSLDKMGNGQIGFYKLNFEAFLMSSGLPYTIVKPCGLGGDAAAQDTLIVGHDDAEGWDLSIPVQRADVARVLAAAAQNPEAAAGLRFDLCSKKGEPTEDDDLPALLKAAKYPWETREGVALV